MKEPMKYDPEDIESLLKHKSFEELYPEEREFILKHIAHEDEYEALRSMLLQIERASNDGEWFEPDAELKQELMQEFAREKKSRFTIWLNSFFSSFPLPSFRRPAYAWSLAGAFALVFGLWFFWPTSPTAHLAEAAAESSKSTSSDTLSSSEKQVTVLAENKPTPAPKALAAMPPAPALVEADVATEQAPVKSMEQISPVTHDEVAKAESTIGESNDANLQIEESYSRAVSKELSDVATVRTESLAKKAPARIIDNSVTASAYSDLLQLLYTAK